MGNVVQTPGGHVPQSASETGTEQVLGTFHLHFWVPHLPAASGSHPVLRILCTPQADLHTECFLNPLLASVITFGNRGHPLQVAPRGSHSAERPACHWNFYWISSETQCSSSFNECASICNGKLNLVKLRECSHLWLKTQFGGGGG